MRIQLWRYGTRLAKWGFEVSSHVLFQRVTCGKNSTIDNLCVMNLSTALGHHRANRSLRTSTNLDAVQPNPFRAARQDDRRISGCMRFVIQIFDDADLAFRVFGAELRTILSTTTVLTDKAAAQQRATYRAAI